MDKDFIEKTITVWQPFSPDKKLTDKDASDIILNIHIFFSLLNEWNKKAERQDNL